MDGRGRRRGRRRRPGRDARARAGDSSQARHFLVSRSLKIVRSFMMFSQRGPLAQPGRAADS